MLSRLRAYFTPLVLLLGAGTFVYLLLEFDPGRLLNHLLAFGWGFAALLPFQILDHSLNAAGWLLAFPPESAGGVRFWDLVRVRIAGDGVNYLTPSAQIGGEFVRPGMLRSDLPTDVKVTSVLVAKVTQSVGQAFFIISGVGYLLHAKLFQFEGRQATLGAVGVGGILFGLVAGVGLLIMEPPAWVQRRFPAAVKSSEGVRGLLKSYLRSHPLRMLGSIAFFMLGYSWGAAEIWLICHFLGLNLSVETAFSIEFLSNLVDSLAFWVPAKLGTQEAGKTAIFAGLGLRPEMGFTVGVIRHVRELVWAGFGLALYGLHQRRTAKKI
ncbi:MAG: flippase-like domain-containing protein [Elusimicrobia bacterium]|nr:flippase-like domain-containing protein [Elusimicrobiota bacterium]